MNKKSKSSLTIVDPELASIIVNNLPRLQDGQPAYPGKIIECDYIGERWEAAIVSVNAVSIDIQYTNNANHRAMGCIAKNARPKEWRSVK